MGDIQWRGTHYKCIPRRFAVSIDLDREDFFEQMDCLDKDKPVAVYCRGGRRSKIAAERFVGKGFEVTELDGGIITWEGEIEK